MQEGQPPAQDPTTNPPYPQGAPTNPPHPQGRMVGNQIIYDQSYRQNFFARETCTRNKVVLLSLIGFFALMSVMLMAVDIITVGVLCLLATLILIGILIWYYKLCQRNMSPNQNVLPPGYVYQAQGQQVQGTTMYPMQQPYPSSGQVPPYPPQGYSQPPVYSDKQAQPYPLQSQPNQAHPYLAQDQAQQQVQQPVQSLATQPNQINSEIPPPPSYEQATNPTN